MNNKYHNAFTLSEILITLSIIAVIAAITLSVFIKNYQKHVTVNRLKEAYTIFSNVIARSVAENGEITEWEKTTDVDTVEKYILPYMKGITTTSRKTKLALSKTTNYIYWNYNKSYNMPNGMSFAFIPGVGAFVSEGLTRIISVDINGDDKGPNTAGKDVFTFSINREKPDFIPIGLEKKYSGGQPITREEMLGKSDRFSYVSGRNGFSGACAAVGDLRYSGLYCAALIVMDGWKIANDYPW